MYPGRNEPGSAPLPALSLGPRGGYHFGSVVLELSNEQVFRVIKDYSGLGETGEAMVAMRHGFMSSSM